MGIYSFEIVGRLPGMNDIIGATNRHRRAGNQLKQEWTNICAVYAKRERIPRIEKPVSITLVWIEPDRRRDIDNVMAGAKFVLDGLVSAGVLKNDGQRYVQEIRSRVSVNKGTGGVKVYIDELDPKRD